MVEVVLSVILVIDGDKNKVLDINFMMMVLDDYFKKVVEGNCGVFINYYLKDIDQKMLVQMWVVKYFFGQFMVIKYDDIEGVGFVEFEKVKL